MGPPLRPSTPLRRRVWPGASDTAEAYHRASDADLEASHEPLGKAVIAHAPLHRLDRILDAQPLGVHALEIEDQRAGPGIAIARLADAARD